MAKVQVCPELLATVLFPNADVTITGIQHDQISGNFVFDVAGSAVPDAAEVNCLISEEIDQSQPGRVLTTKFVAP